MCAGVNYEIKQRLIALFGKKQWAVGPISDTMKITTSSSSPPSGLSTKEKDEETIIFSWKPAAVKVPQQSLEYQVSLHNSDCFSGEQIQSNSVTDTEFKVMELLPAYVYCLSVKSIALSNAPLSCIIKLPDQKEQDLNCKYHNSVQLTVSTNPSPPTRIQVTETTPDSVSLKWDKPIISPTASLLRYSVEITRVDPSSKEALSTGSQSVESETETVSVGALASGATYKFQVMVITTEGDSSLSNPVTAATKIFQETELQQLRKTLNLNSIESDLSSLNGKIVSADTRMSTAERKIGSAEDRLDVAEGKIVSAETRMSNAEGKIVSAETRMSNAEGKIRSAENRLDAAERTGSWCAYQDKWTSRSAVITYVKILHADSNINGNALNTRTGEN